MNAHQTTCPNCHQPMAAGLQFCTQCGSSLAASVAQQPMPQTSLPSSSYPNIPRQGKKSSQTIIIVAIVGVFLLLLVGGGLFFILSSNSDKNKDGVDNDEAASSVDEESDDQDEDGKTDEESSDSFADEESDDQDEDGKTDDDGRMPETQIDGPDESNYGHLNAYIDVKYDRCSDIRVRTTLANEIPYSIQDCDPLGDEDMRHGFEIMKADTGREGLLEMLKEGGYFECMDAGEEGYLAVISDSFALHSWIIYGRDENLELGTAEYINGLNNGTRAESQILEEEGFEVEIVNACQV